MAKRRYRFGREYYRNWHLVANYKQGSTIYWKWEQ
jgi:hypothetical protein